MGWKFTLTRFVVNLLGIGVIAYLTECLMKPEEKEAVLANAQALDNG